MIRVGLMICFFATFAQECCGHSGGLDRNGGHHNRRTGGYHYHSGAFSRPATYSPPHSPPRQRTSPARRQERTKARTSYRSSARSKAPIAKSRRVRTKARTIPPRQTELPRYQKSKHDFKVKILLLTDKLVETHILDLICKNENEDEVHFYLPGSDTDAGAWAITTRSHRKYRTRIDRRSLPTTYPMKIQCRVIGVLDGDSVNVVHDRHQYSVNFRGIDCPEIRQPYGRAAKQLTSDLCFRKDVTIVMYGMDRDHNLLAELKVGADAASLNQRLLTDGLAWYLESSNANDDLAKLEGTAKANKIGLWQEKNAVAPWEWRINN